jgi:O-antigen/teichoic acid export membrane protein
LSSQWGRQAGSALFWKSIQLVGGKSIFLIRTLVLAWLLAPEDFGLLAISMLAVDILMSVTNLGMIPALVQLPEPGERQYNAAWTAGMARALLITLVIFLAAPLIATWFAEPRATDLIRLAAIRPVLEAAASIKVAELTRNLRFRTLTFIYLPEALANTVVSLVLAPVLGVWALIAGTLAGSIALIISSYVLAPHRPRLVLDATDTRPLIQFGRWIFLIGLVSVIGRSVLQLVISRKLGAADLGLYFMASKLAFIPAEISSDVIGAVAFPLYSRLQTDKQQVVRAFQAILIGMSALLLPVCALLIALAPSLVENLLGPRWQGTVPLIQLLALVNVIGLFGDTVTPILQGLGRPSQIVILELVQSTLLIALIWGVSSQFGVTGAAVAWLVAIGASQLLSVLFVQRIVPDPLSGVARPLGVITAVSGMGAVVALVMDNLFAGMVGFVFAGLVGMLLIGGLLWLLDLRWHMGLTANLGQSFPQLAVLFRVAPIER